jgi:hypothetical protein
LSTRLEEILSTKTKRVKSDDDFYKRCFVKLSESYKKQVKSSLNNFHCWLNNNEHTLESFLIRIKGIEDEVVKEEMLVDVFNAYLQGLLSEHTCPHCLGRDNPPKSEWSNKNNHSKCHVCHGKKTLKAVRPSTLRGAFTHLKKYLGYYGLPEVHSKTFSQQIDLPKIVEEQAEPLTNEMFDELFNDTRKSVHRLYLIKQKTDGMRPREAMQLTEKHYEPISTDYEKMDIPENWTDLKKNPKFRRLRIVLRSDMTKTGKGRHTWVSKQIENQMLDLLDERKGELLFSGNKDPEKAVHNMSSWFNSARKRLGKINPKWLQKYDDGKGEYKYRIYSLRAKFITDSLKADPSGNAGHSFAGHIKYMQVYERFTIEESCKMYDKCEEGFKGNVAKVEEEVSELRQENMKLREEIHIEREQNKIDIQKILDNAEKNRLNDLAEIEIKIAESEISKSKKKSK